MTPIVTVQNLVKQYNPPQGETAVKGINFHINQGEIFSLLGPNGAGKTTTISMLSGLLEPTSGEAKINGRPIHTNAQDVKQLIGIVPQEIALYQSISARENLKFWGRMYGLGGEKLEERITAVLDIAGLADRADEKVESYSGGMKRRINIAVGLLHSPKVLFMDEPTVGIDPQSRRRILDTVKSLNEEGLTVVYTTHYMEEAEELSDRVGIIDHGELIAIGTQAELSKTVGELDTIRLTLTSEESESVRTALRQLSDVTHINGEAEQLILQTPDADTLLPQALNLIAQQGSSVRQMRVEEPNLEAVFLHLTGRALRD